MSKKVIVVGGGIGGLSSAYYLHKKGLDVTVIDRGALDDSASIGNAGFLSMFEKSPMAYPGVFMDTLRAFVKNRTPMVINSVFDWKLAKWGYQFARATSRGRYNRTLAVLDYFGEEVFSFYDNLTNQDGIDVEYHRDGFALVYTDKKTYQKKLDTIPKGSDRFEVPERDKLEEIFPFVKPETLAGAVVLKRNGHLNPGKVISGLHHYLASNGVVFHLNEEVISIECDGNSVISVQSKNSSYEADEFILASGANLALADQLKSDLLITPGRGYSLTFKMEEELKPTIPALFCDIYTAVTPRREDVRITGKIEFGKIRETPQNRAKGLVSILKNYTRDFTISDEKVWAGDRPLTGNDMPYLGRDHRYRNFSYVMGLGHTGINIGPVCGRIISEVIASDLDNTEHGDLLNLSQFYQH